MLAFNVQINSDRPVRAGSPTAAVLTVIATYVSSRNELELTVGGLLTPHSAHRENAEWLKRELKVGDRVTLEVVDSDSADPPIAVRQQDPESAAQEKRRYYEMLKAEYEGPGGSS